MFFPSAGQPPKWIADNALRPKKAQWPLSFSPPAQRESEKRAFDCLLSADDGMESIDRGLPLGGPSWAPSEIMHRS